MFEKSKGMMDGWMEVVVVVGAWLRREEEEGGECITLWGGRGTITLIWG